MFAVVANASASAMASVGFVSRKSSEQETVESAKVASRTIFIFIDMIFLFNNYFKRIH
jgi:hypothetical protein